MLIKSLIYGILFWSQGLFLVLPIMVEFQPYKLIARFSSKELWFAAILKSIKRNIFTRLK